MYPSSLIFQFLVFVLLQLLLLGQMTFSMLDGMVQTGSLFCPKSRIGTIFVKTLRERSSLLDLERYNLVLFCKFNHEEERLFGKLKYIEGPRNIRVSVDRLKII